MKITATQIDFCNGAPDRARKTRDEPDKLIRIVNRARLAELVKGGMDPQQAIGEAITAHLYLRWTKAGVCYAVGLFLDSARDGTDLDYGKVGSLVYYGHAGGYGYDKAAAALRGMPIAMNGSEPVVLTDHCGLDRYDPNPYPGMREIVANDSPNLPEFLFTI